MEHEFPEGFKPVNIESYDGTTDPTVWVEDFLLHIHMAPCHQVSLAKTQGTSPPLVEQSARKLHWQLGELGRCIPGQLPGHLGPTSGCR